MTGTADEDNQGLPRGLRPMLATAGPLPAGEPGWALEMKWDGLRALCYVTGGGTRLVSRTGRDITSAYPELAWPPPCAPPARSAPCWTARSSPSPAGPARRPARPAS